MGKFRQFSRIFQAAPHATVSSALTFCVAAQHFFPIVALGLSMREETLLGNFRWRPGEA
jgi:hypothetical protein